MRNYKTIGIYFIVMTIFLILWFEHLHVNSVSTIKDVQGILNMTNENSGFNYFIQHLSLYLFCEQILLIQILPRMDCQVLTRTTRWKQWKKNIISAFYSATLYTFFFEIVHIFLLHSRATWKVLLEFDLLTVMAINFVMMSVTYLLWNCFFLFFYSIFLKNNIATVLTILVAVSMPLAERFLGILEIPFPVFQYFYTIGINIKNLFAELVSRVSIASMLFLVSGMIYEKKDLLND